MIAKKIIISVILLLIIAICIILNLYFHDNEKLPTYFSYSPKELAVLKKSSSSIEMNSSILKNWDDVLFDLVRKNKLDADSSKIYAYVYTAQYEAASLSYNLNHQFTGSIGPITKLVLCEFFAADCNSIFVPNTDAYSQQLADVIIAKIRERIKADAAQNFSYPAKVGPQYWTNDFPFGQAVGSWKTWLITSSDQFRAPNPPTEAAWAEQTQEVKKQIAQLSMEQKKSLIYWAGGPGTISPPGIWLVIARDYMQHINLSLKKQLEVRTLLAMTLADAFIAVFDSKYTYFQRRPFMRDASIQPTMPTPNHPSYPSAHSAISSSAAVILSYYFPERKSYWHSKANDASSGRVWGGIHFPIDAKAGMQMGENIGNYIVSTHQYKK